MKLRLCTIMLLLLTVISCSDAQINEVNKRYSNYINQFPTFLVDHFPAQIEDLPVVVTLNNDTTGMCISFRLIKYYEEEYKAVIPITYQKYYQATDSNLVVIKRKRLLKNNNEKYNKKTFDIYKPIPFFEREDYIDFQSIFSEQTKSGLSENFIIYVEDYQTGQYIKGLKPLFYMPEEWRNGYSKGVAIDQSHKIIIYWFVAW